MKTLWNSSLSHDFIVLLLLISFVFLLPQFCGNPLLKHRCPWQGLLYFSTNWGLWYLQIASKVTWCYDHVVFETFPISRTPILVLYGCFETEYFIENIWGDNWAVRILLKLAWYLSWCPIFKQSSACGNWLFSAAALLLYTVNMMTLNIQKLLSEPPLWTHRLVFLAKVSEILFFGSIWNMRFPNSQPPSLQICSHTLYIFIPQHVVSYVVSLKTWQMSWEFRLTAEIKGTHQETHKRPLDLDSYVFKLSVSTGHWVLFP